MKKLFFDHLIIIEELIIILNSNVQDRSHKQELLNIIDKTMIHEILTVILKHLPKQYHEEFLIRFHATPNDSSNMIYLKEKTTIDIEKEILKTADAVKKLVYKKIKKYSNAG